MTNHEMTPSDLKRHLATYINPWSFIAFSFIYDPKTQKRFSWDFHKNLGSEMIKLGGMPLIVQLWKLQGVQMDSGSKEIIYLRGYL